MNTIKIIFAALLMMHEVQAAHVQIHKATKPPTHTSVPSIRTDSRIKTHSYDPNAIYKLMVRYGFQSYIELGRDEEIRTIVLGDAYAWKVTKLENRIFIKPLEENINTNMTVITTKRTYNFDVASHKPGQEVTYNIIRFSYPQVRASNIKL